MPASSTVALPSTMYGSSCVSTPMPWPVRWMNSSPYPPSMITWRAAASTDSAVTPGRACAQAASCASCSTRK